MAAFGLQSPAEPQGAMQDQRQEKGANPSTRGSPHEIRSKVCNDVQGADATRALLDPSGDDSVSGS